MVLQNEVMPLISPPPHLIFRSRLYYMLQGWQKNKKFEKNPKKPGFFKKTRVFPWVFSNLGFFKICLRKKLLFPSFECVNYWKK